MLAPKVFLNLSNRGDRTFILSFQQGIDFIPDMVRDERVHHYQNLVISEILLELEFRFSQQGSLSQHPD